MNGKVKKPCKLCPFKRTCPKSWLGKTKVEEILNSIENLNQAFPCHETTGVKEGVNVPLMKQSFPAGS